MVNRDALYVDIGARIRRRREQMFLSQATLARKVGLKRSSISNIEAGRQRMLVHSLADLAWVLNIPLRDLIPAQPALDPVTTDVRIGREEKRWIDVMTGDVPKRNL